MFLKWKCGAFSLFSVDVLGQAHIETKRSIPSPVKHFDILGNKVVGSLSES